MKKYHLIVLLGLFICHSLWSQDKLPIKEVLPPPPDVAGIEKYGAVPTTLYSGLPNISIPIYTIRSKSIEVPISLSYHAGGIKVNDISGPVGLGWSLNAGGYLTRVIQGRDDLIHNGGGFFSTSEFESAYEAVDGGFNESQLKNIFCQLEDNEPDIFSFQVPSGSGKFFYDTSGELHMLSVQDFDFLNENNRFNLEGYRIVDGNGRTFYFNADDVESQNSAFPAGATGAGPYGWECIYPESFGVNKTAKLSGITSIDGGSIEFIYDTVEYKYLTGYNEIKVMPTSQTLSFADNESWSGVEVNHRRLRSIKSLEGYKVDFDYSNNGPGILSKITVSYQDNILKVFELAYQNFNTISSNVPPSMPTGFYNSRDKLVSVLESGKGEYSFEYNETPLPPRFSFAQDYWGFYNGENDNQSLVPNKDPNTGEPINLEFKTLGNRDASKDFMRAGVISRINYPTGGATEFSFDTNKRILLEGDGCVTQYRQGADHYELTAFGANCEDGNGGDVDATTGQKIVSIPDGATQIRAFYTTNISNPNTSAIACENGLAISRTLLDWAGGGFTLNIPNHQYSIPDGVTNLTIDMMLNGYGDVYNDSNPPGVFDLANARVVVTWQESYQVCDEVVEQSLGGLRLSSQRTLIGDEVQEERVYGYSGAQYQIPLFSFNKYGRNKDSGSGCWLEEDIDPVMVVQSNSLNQTNTLFGGSTIYNRVHEHFTSPSTYELIEGSFVEKAVPNLGKIVYEYDHTLDNSIRPPNWSSGVIIDRSHLRGLLKRKETYGLDTSTNQYKIVSLQENSYLTDQLFNYHGYRVDQLVREMDNSSCDGGSQTPPPTPGIYAYFHYNLNSHWVRLDESTQTDYLYDDDWNYNGSLSTTTNYVYDTTNYQPNEITEFQSARTQRTVSQYGFSQASSRPTSVELLWVDENHEGIPLTTGDFEAGELRQFTYQGTSTINGLDNQTFLAYNLTNQKIERDTEVLQDVTFEYGDFARVEKVTDNIADVSTNYRYREDAFEYPKSQCNDCEAFFNFSFETTAGLEDSLAFSGSKVRQITNTNPFEFNPFVLTGYSGELGVRYWHKSSLTGEWSLRTDFDLVNNEIRITELGYIDDLSIYPKGKHLSSYVYQPGFGLTKKVDANGNQVDYVYDAFGRLIRTVDTDKKVLNENQYHYKTADQ